MVAAVIQNAQDNALTATTSEPKLIETAGAGIIFAMTEEAY